MPLVKCPHCPERVRPKQLPLHLKKCISKRRKDKAAGAPAQKAIYAADQQRIDAEDLALKRAELEKAEAKLAVARESLGIARGKTDSDPKPSAKKKGNRK